MNSLQKNLIFIGIDSMRSRAYLSLLKEKKILPSRIILLNSKVDSNINIKNHYFDGLTSVSKFAFINNINIDNIKTADINNKKVLSLFSEIDSKLVLFSGSSGQIICKKLLSQNFFLHAHPGKLPEFKGSTTMYYSLLIKKKFACSVILMSHKIDSGKILKTNTFKIPEDKKMIDYIYDPFIRAKTMQSLLMYYKKNNRLPLGNKNDQSNKMYYIIHPVLKHIAIIS